MKKFRIIAAVLLVAVLFGCYVVAKNSAPEEGAVETSEDGAQGGYGGLGK